MTPPTTYQKIVLFLFLLCLPIGAAIYAYILISDTWYQIEINTDIVTYLKGDGYMFIMLGFPFFYITILERYRKYQLYAFYIVLFFGLSSLLITPRVIDYITEQKLIEKSYSFCSSERVGSIRQMKQIWQLNTPCKKKEEDKEELMFKNSNSIQF